MDKLLSQWYYKMWIMILWLKKHLRTIIRITTIHSYLRIQSLIMIQESAIEDIQSSITNICQTNYSNHTPHINKRKVCMDLALVNLKTTLQPKIYLHLLKRAISIHHFDALIRYNSCFCYLSNTKFEILFNFNKQ